MHLLLQSFEKEASFSTKIKFTTDTTMKISISEQLLTQQVDNSKTPAIFYKLNLFDSNIQLKWWVRPKK